MKILVMYDKYVTEEHFKEGLQGIMRDCSTRMVELDRLRRTLRTLSTRAIHEYVGSPEQLIEEIRDEEILVVNFAPVTAEVMEAGTNLKLIACCRGGPVNVHISAATERGIIVVNTPERAVEAAADFTIGLLIVEARHIARAHHILSTGGEFRGNPRLYGEATVYGVELSGKTLGIVGLGNIGLRVAKRAKAFGMNLLAYDPYVPRDKGKKFGIFLVDLDTLLKKSDFVSLHARISHETRGIIGSSQLSLMKKTAYLINTARGALVDEEALYEALRNRSIAGAALDVFEKEPVNINNPILKLNNVTVTPHIAGISREVPLKSAIMIGEELERYVSGKELKNIFNPEVLSK